MSSVAMPVCILFGLSHFSQEDWFAERDAPLLRRGFELACSSSALHGCSFLAFVSPVEPLTFLCDTTNQLGQSEDAACLGTGFTAAHGLRHN